MEFSLILLLTGAAALSLLLPAAVRLYMEALPEAPACPACRTLTRHADTRLGERVLSAISTTVIRACARCGWRGRMRWKLAPHQVRGDGRRG